MGELRLSKQVGYATQFQGGQERELDAYECFPMKQNFLRSLAQASEGGEDLDKRRALTGEAGSDRAHEETVTDSCPAARWRPPNSPLV